MHRANYKLLLQTSLLTAIKREKGELLSSK